MNIRSSRRTFHHSYPLYVQLLHIIPRLIDLNCITNEIILYILKPFDMQKIKNSKYISI